jgi:outer membrane protein TolC
MQPLHAFTLIAALAVNAAAQSALTFDEARKAMLAANPQAASAAADLETARSRVTGARAGLYPSVSASAGYARGGMQGADASDSYSYGVNGTQPLFSPAITAGLRSAKASLNISEASYDRVAARLSYELKAAFADILNARETIKLSQETLKRRAENLELIRLKYQAGRENKAALLETEAVLKTAEWQHERYRKNLRLLERRLNRLLARSSQAAVPDLALPQPPEPPADFSAFAAALETHYSLRSARATVAISNYSIDAARSVILPAASASGNYSWAGASWPASSNSWSLGASLSLPLFSGGRLSSGLAAARSSLRSSEAALRDAREEVSLNAEDAFLAWREARSYMDVARSSLGAAEARAWLVRKQYLAGQSSYFEWRNVEEQLISEQNQYLAAGRGLSLGYAAFTQAIGEQ